MVRALLAAIVAASIFPVPGRADPTPIPRAFLFDWCNRRDIAERRAYCFGYIAGVSDGLQRRTTGDRLCYPSRIDFATVVDVVLRDLGNAAAGSGETAASVVELSLLSRYGCRR